jgi:alpha-beta hydrolase superfamily lysophospholipase
MEKESIDKQTSSLSVNDNIEIINDNFIKGDPSLIFEEYKENNVFEFHLEVDGIRLKIETYRYVSTESPKALVIFFHGLCGNMKTSAFLAKALAEDGFLVVGYDYRGHGKSEGKRVFFSCSEQVIEDSLNFVNLVTKIYPNLSVFLGGISFGGFISYQLSLKYPDRFKSVIMLAPALKPIQGCFMKSLASLVGSLFPKLYFSGKKGKSNVTKNVYAIEESLKANRKKSVPASTLKAVLNGISKCEESFGNYTTDVLIFMGGKDKVISAKGAFDFITRAQSKEKKLYYYENLYHNILLEEEIYDIIVKIKEWMKKYI